MGLMEVAMLPRSTRWMKKFLNDDAGVTALEYCILFSGLAFLITIGSFKGIGPEISRHLGNSMKPKVAVAEVGGCPAHNSGATGNCGVGLGGGGGNGTPNEGNGKGPGADKEKFENPGRGNR